MAPKPRDVAERFWEKVTRGDGCWLWTASQMGAGYGKFYYERRWTGAHRVAWILTNGAVPPGRVVMHVCDNPLCVRPDHLTLGTQNDNVQDMCEKGRQYTRP